MLVPPMTKYTIHHGSDKIIEKPILGLGKSDNDYGSGFYTTQNFSQAESWAVLFGSKDAIVNNYEIDTKGLTILNLDDYGPLAWIAELAYNRYMPPRGCETIVEEFVEKYKVNTDNADIIIGCRADGNYMETIDLFFKNELNIDEVIRLFTNENLGTQFVLKSKEAFDTVKFIGYDIAKDNENIKAHEQSLIDTSRFINNRKAQMQEQGYEPQGILVRTACEIRFEYDSEYEFLKPDMTWKEYEEFEELLKQESLKDHSKANMDNICINLLEKEGYIIQNIDEYV